MQPRLTVCADISKAKVRLAAVSIELLYEIDEDTVTEVSEKISAAEMSGQPYLPVYISSPGGCCYSAIAIVNMFKTCKIPIWTIIMSQASSAAAVLFSCGERRFVAPGAQAMIHEVSVGGGFGMTKSTDLESDAKHTRKLQRQLFKIMADNCGHPSKYWIDLIKQKHNTDVWLNADDMAQHKLMTDAGVPILNAHVSLDFKTDVRAAYKVQGGGISKKKLKEKRKKDEAGEGAALKKRRKDLVAK